jgi:crotonobetainyl-CoA:carnitine CoA-transferase CaiB-like acyl-CoA transferase
LCRALGRAELAEDERFARNVKRRENLAALDPLLCDLFHRRTTNEWVNLLSEFEVPCAPLQNVAQAVCDPQVQTRKMIVQVDDAKHGKQRVVNTPLRFSATPAEVKRSSPELGEHSHEVLKEWLGV